MKYRYTVLFVIIIFPQVQLSATDTDGHGIGVDSDVYNSKQYVRKCCPHGKGIIGTACRNMSEPFNLTVWSGSKQFKASKEVDIIVGLNCSITKGSTRVLAYKTYHEGYYYLTPNGSLKLVGDLGYIAIFDQDNYCLDNYYKDNSTVIVNTMFCQPKIPFLQNYILNAYCMLISCFFILLTVGVYACLPKMCNLPNKVLIAYLLSFFVSFLCLATITFLEGKGPSRNLCNVLTFIIYFSMLAAFCWINVMSYDIWKKFGGEMKHRMSSPGSRFYWYCLYGFGVPTVMSAMLATFEFTDIQVPIKPELDVQKCFFDGLVKRVYLYIPILIVCIVNIIFFILTAIKIACDQRHAKELRSQGGRIHNRREEKRFLLYMKLFTMMGISWVLEVISSFYPTAYVVWQFTDVYNMLVGLIIFIMVVCERKMLDKIKNRFVITRKLTRSTAQTTMTISQQVANTPDIAMNTGHIEIPVLNGDRYTKIAEDYI